MSRRDVYADATIETDGLGGRLRVQAPVRKDGHHWVRVFTGEIVEPVSPPVPMSEGRAELFRQALARLISGDKRTLTE